MIKGNIIFKAPVVLLLASLSSNIWADSIWSSSKTLAGPAAALYGIVNGPPASKTAAYTVLVGCTGCPCNTPLTPDIHVFPSFTFNQNTFVQANATSVYNLLATQIIPTAVPAITVTPYDSGDNPVFTGGTNTCFPVTCSSGSGTCVYAGGAHAATLTP